MAKKPWQKFHVWKARRVKRVTANTWNLDQQLERDQRERAYIQEDIRKRQLPEVDHFEQGRDGEDQAPKNRNGA